MPAERLLLRPPELPEWRRSGRFFVIAVALHLAILAWPRSEAVELLRPIPLSARLVDASKPAAEPLPIVSPPPKPAKPAGAKPLPKRAVPVLAMTPEPQPPGATTPVVAAPTPVLAAADPAPATALASTPAAAAPLLAPRFNAAYLNNPEPKYPALSRRLGEEGKVLLKVRVSAQGLPMAVELEKSSTFARLDEAARQAVAGWRFVPARRGDEAIETSVIVPVVFRLDS